MIRRVSVFLVVPIEGNAACLHHYNPVNQMQEVKGMSYKNPRLPMQMLRQAVLKYLLPDRSVEC